MKKILIIIVLNLLIINPSKAENITEFQIEGISLYDSALNHFSKTKIENSPKVTYRDKSYTTAAIRSSKFKTYQSIQITYKTNDKKFIIKDIAGDKYIDYKKCMEELKKINSEFDKLFPDAKKDKLETYTHPIDKTRKSKISDIYWNFENGDLIVLSCYDWSSQIKKQKKWEDQLRIAIGSKEVHDFFSSNPY
tara:strand:- start:46 stop:624 length:579 start_codon:yes stop_codon:yes gene_type:complete